MLGNAWFLAFAFLREMGLSSTMALSKMILCEVICSVPASRLLYCDRRIESDGLGGAKRCATGTARRLRMSRQASRFPRESRPMQCIGEMPVIFRTAGSWQKRLLSTIREVVENSSVFLGGEGT